MSKNPGWWPTRALLAGILIFLSIPFQLLTIVFGEPYMFLSTLADRLLED